MNTASEALKNIATVFIIMFLVVAMGFVVTFLIFYKQLPQISNLQDYRPPVVSSVYARDGQLIGEFYKEKRYLVQLNEIPNHVIKAFISAEDDRFFEHGGIDFQGILRALIADLKAGKVVQGGSTITQQVAKSMLLTSERSFERKFKEAILASQIERNFTKEQILYLYLNQIYLGNGAYGVEAAARTYFRKSVKALTIAEAAVLAGLVKAPTKYTPLKNPKRARERQIYVLGRMLETKAITQEEYQKAVQEPVRIYLEEDINLKYAPYYVEYVRQYAQEKYGEDQLLTKGLSIQVAANSKLSQTAMEAIQKNLKDLDKRQGYRGPLMHLSSEAQMLDELKKIRWEVFEKKYPMRILPTEHGEEDIDQSKWLEYTLNKVSAVEKFSGERDLLIPGETYRAVVTKIDPDGKNATLLMGTIRAKLPLRNMSWAKLIHQNEVSNSATIGHISETLKTGDVVLVSIVNVPNNKEDDVTVALDQEPIVQGSLLSMEANTGNVIAMVGGYDFKQSVYNRALQGERQPGSSFKPFLYASAIDKGFTAASIIVDSPIIFEGSGKDDLKWTPENNSEKFYGDTTLSMALVKSRNVPTVKLLQNVEVPYFVKYLRNLGISKQLNEDLSLALGSHSMTLLELTKLYALFPRMGRRIEPVFILKIMDAQGKVLEEYSAQEAEKQAAEKWLKYHQDMGFVKAEEPKPENVVANDIQNNVNQVAIVGDAPKSAEQRKAMPDVFNFDDPLRAMNEKTAYIMTHILQEVVLYGTGAAARSLDRKIGGKTGTTNDFVDAWFLGFSPEVITGVWSGFDTPRTLGRGEVGARAALPAWTSYMQKVLDVYPKDEYEIPKGIVFVRINPETGQLATSSANSVKEAFIEGTEPTKENQQGSDSSEFFREDM